jgi:hypothetical protein
MGLITDKMQAQSTNLSGVNEQINKKRKFSQVDQGEKLYKLWDKFSNTVKSNAELESACEAMVRETEQIQSH